MTRIIPWTLPPVKGGSIGGYTEHGSGSGGDTPEVVQHFEFSKPDKIEVEVSFPSTTITSSWKNLAVNALKTFTLQGGFTALDLTGVASLRVIINNHHVLSGAEKEITNLVLSVDPVTRAATMVSVESCRAKEPSTSTTTSAYVVATWGTNTGTIQYVAYNGNGEILETSEAIAL